MVVWVEILEAKYGQVVMYFMVFPVELRQDRNTSNFLKGILTKGIIGNDGHRFVQGWLGSVAMA